MMKFQKKVSVATTDHFSKSYRYPFYITLIFKNIFGIPAIYYCSLMFIYVTDTTYPLVLAKVLLFIKASSFNIENFKSHHHETFFKIKSSTPSPSWFWRVDTMMYQGVKGNVFFINYIVSVISFYLSATVTWVIVTTLNTVCWPYVKNENLWLIKERI